MLQVIILNPNGTVNEELMLANGMTIETIRAVTDAATGQCRAAPKQTGLDLIKFLIFYI